VPEDLALGTVRFSLGKHNTSDDIDYVLEKLPLVVKRLRALFYSS
jgi:cysteine desulfurase